MTRWKSLATLAVGLGSAACGGHEQPRVVARDVDLIRCAVDSKAVYVWGHESLSRVDRASGSKTFLTNDVHHLQSMLVNDGSVYFLDADGVYAWPSGANARKVIAEFPRGSHHPSELARFGSRVCWTAVNQGRPAVDCFDLQTHEVATWFADDTARAESGVIAASIAGDAQHLYLAELLEAGRSRILEVSDQKARVIGEVSLTVVGLYATPMGVALIEPADEVAGAAPKIWVAERKPHEFAVPQNAGLLDTFGTRSFLTIGDGPPLAVDLASGKVRALSTLYGEALCGDDKSIFSAGDREHSTLVEIPNK